MIIPHTSDHPRYYVAINSEEAYCSFASYEEAKDNINAMIAYKLDYASNVAGIVEVGKTYKVWVFHTNISYGSFHL
jgi:hypothetical protein